MTVSEKGSAILYILIAIALIAALTYYVSTGSRTSESNLSKERSIIIASEIIDYGNTVAKAVQKLKLRGCSDTEINFDNTVVAGYTNPGAPADESCNIFSTNGGALNWTEPPVNANDGTDYVYGPVMKLIAPTADQPVVTGNVDLVFLLARLNESVCLAINEKIGITGNIVDSGDMIDGGWPPQFTGTYTVANSISGTSNNCPDTFCAYDAGCFKEGAGEEAYIYYQVLIQRVN